MRPEIAHRILAGTALGLALVAAALAQREASPAAAAPQLAPATLDARALGQLLGQSPPDVVVVALDEPKHALRFAQPAALYGATDEELVARAPRRSIVLVGTDVVRVDRVARRLLASGHDVRVLAGGLATWDKLIDEEPAAPPAGAGEAVWQAYREHLALRRVFGDADGAPAAPVMAPPVAPAAPAGAVAKKREGC